MDNEPRCVCRLEWITWIECVVPSRVVIPNPIYETCTIFPFRRKNITCNNITCAENVVLLLLETIVHNIFYSSLPRRKRFEENGRTFSKSIAVNGCVQ